MPSKNPRDATNAQYLGASKLTEKQVAVEGNEREELIRKMIGRRLRKVWQNIYGKTTEPLDKDMEGWIEKGEKIVEKLKEIKCSDEVAIELTSLTFYNVAILIDDSGTMILEEDGKRKKTLKTLLGHILEICSTVNEPDTHNVRFLNTGKPEMKRGENWEDYLDRHEFGGVTRIGTELKRQILDDPMINNTNPKKPLRVLIFTDGAIEGERKGYLEDVIQKCVKDRKGENAVSFHFSRIGNDDGAYQLLKGLDNDLNIGENIDVFDVISDVEGQLDDEWLAVTEILVGGI